MKVFLAGVSTNIHSTDGSMMKVIEQQRPFLLESFAYVNRYTDDLIRYSSDFILDSGAFTYIYKAKGKAQGAKIDWEEYARRYADYIVSRKIEKYIELDIDSLIGYDGVLKLRKTLEKLTGRPCMPVWHTSRGRQDFEDTCRRYRYFAIGGLTVFKKDWSLLKPFIHEAHRHGCRIHGLGFTKTSMLNEMPWDSVDSSSWSSGGRYGFIYKFDGEKLI